jgi:uncharacterized protein
MALAAIRFVFVRLDLRRTSGIVSSMPNPAEHESTSPRRGRCPRCGASFEYASVAAHKPFPFCSARCRDVDLGNWISGKYVIPGAPLPPSPNTNSEDLADDGT